MCADDVIHDKSITFIFFSISLPTSPICSVGSLVSWLVDRSVSLYVIHPYITLQLSWNAYSFLSFFAFFISSFIGTDTVASSCYAVSYYNLLQ